MVRVYRRYLAVDPSVTERFASLLLSSTNNEPRPLEAAKLLLSLARKAARGEYTSPEGKSPYQLLEDWIEVVEKYPEEVGLDVEETLDSNAAFAKEEAEAEAAKTNDPNPEAASTNGQLIRVAGPPVVVGPDGKPLPPYNEAEDPLSPKKINIEHVIEKDGLDVYKDQAGRLWTGLATYWIKRGEFDRAKTTFEQGMKTVLTIRDFTLIYDAYAEFDESLIGSLMEAIENGDEEDEGETAELENELDVKMKEMEALADRRPFLHNDVLLRRNPHDVQEWEKRAALWGEDDEQVRVVFKFRLMYMPDSFQVAKTYTTALETINPRKATANLHRLYINFAKFYEEGGVTNQAEPDIGSARKILEKASKVNFRAVDDLAEVWCEWSEMELRHGYVKHIVIVILAHDAF